MIDLRARPFIQVRLDRLQIAAEATGDQKPPPLPGFNVVRDSFVRCQTTTATYARCRQFKSQTNDLKIYWQYRRTKGWFPEWKITMVPDDKKGLSFEEIEFVLSHCKTYQFLTIEVAIDFAPCTGVDRRFIRRHAVFGKSRRQNKK